MRKIHGGLAGGISAANHEDVLVLAKLGFARAGAVKQSGAAEAVFIGKVEFAITYAGGADGCVHHQLGAVGEVGDAFAGSEIAINAFAQNQDFRTEFLGLFACAQGQVRAADSIRKAKIVFDLGGAAGLPAYGVAFDHHGF